MGIAFQPIAPAEEVRIDSHYRHESECFIDDCGIGILRPNFSVYSSYALAVGLIQLAEALAGKKWIADRGFAPVGKYALAAIVQDVSIT